MLPCFRQAPMDLRNLHRLAGDFVWCRRWQTLRMEAREDPRERCAAGVGGKRFYIVFVENKPLGLIHIKK